MAVTPPEEAGNVTGPATEIAVAPSAQARYQAALASSVTSARCWKRLSAPVTSGG